MGRLRNQPALGMYNLSLQKANFKTTHTFRGGLAFPATLLPTCPLGRPHSKAKQDHCENPKI